MLAEELEPRRLLSAVPLTTQQINTLKDDLPKISDIGEHVDSQAALNQPLPMLGTAFTSVIDLSDVLQDRFASPLSLYLQPGQTSDEIAAYLSGDLDGQFAELTFGVGPTVGGEVNGELIFDTTLFATRSVAYRLDLGDDAEAAGLSVADDGSAEGVARFEATVDLRFGLDLAGEFFVEIQSLRVGASDAAEIVASAPKPPAAAIDQPVTFTVLINDTTSVTATLPATTSGNLTPLAERLSRAIEEPLAETEYAGGLRFTEFANVLALRSTSPSIQSLQLSGDTGLELLGFAPSAVATNLLQPNLEYGLVGLQTVSGGVAIAGTLDVIADTGGDGRLDSTELLASPALTLIPGRDAKASFAVRPNASGFAGSPGATVRATRRRLFGLAEPEIQLDAFASIDELHDKTVRALNEGLAAVTQFAARMESSGPFSNTLPALESSLGELADFDTALQTHLQQPIETLLAANDRPSWDDVRDALAGVPGVAVTASSRDAEQVLLEVQLDHGRTVGQSLVLGSTIEDSGLVAAADALPTVNVRSDTNWQFDFRIDRRQSAAPLESFAVAFDSVIASATANESPQLDGRIGLLGVSSSGGQLVLNATLTPTIAGGQPITASELIETPIDSLITASSSGSMTVDLPLSGTIGSETLAASIGLSTGNVFDATAELQPNGFDVFDDFQSFGAGDLIGGIEQLGGWFGDFSGERLTSSVPFAATRFGEAVDLAGAFRQQLSDRLKNSDGTAVFSTASQLQTLIPALTAVDYLPSSSELTLDFTYVQAMTYEQPDGTTSGDLEANLEFDFDLGELVGITSDGKLSLSAEVDSRFRMAIDLNPLGADAAAIVPTTPLADLNAGMGVMIDPGDDLRVELRNGTSFLINLDGTSTVGELIEAIHAARDAAGIPAPHFRVEIREENAKGVGLRMTNEGPDAGSDFRISAVGGSLAGLGLGLVGFDEDGDGVIDGKPLHGDTFAHHVYIERLGDAPLAAGTVELRNGGFDASANLGFVAVDIRDAGFESSAGIPSHVTAAVDLVDPVTGLRVNRLSLADLFGSLDADASSASARSELSGRIDLNLPVLATVAGATFGGNIDVTLSEFSEPAPVVTYAVDAELLDLIQVQMSDVLDGLRGGLADLFDLGSQSAFAIGLPIVDASLPQFVELPEFLSQLTAAIDSIGESSLNVIAKELQRIAGEPINLPAIDVALADLAGFLLQTRDLQQAAGGGDVSLVDLQPLFSSHFDVDVSLPDIAVAADRFGDFTEALSAVIDRLQLTEGGSLQQLEATLESALAVPADALNLGIDSAAGSFALRFDLQLDKSVTSQLPIRLGLSDLGIDGVGDLIDVSGSSTLDLSAGAGATLSLGLDVSPSAVRPFLYRFDPTAGDGTHVRLTAGATAENIEFDASLGPLGVAIVGGSAGINRTGTIGDVEPAEFLVTPDDAGDGRIYLDQAVGLTTSASGGAFASLPIQIPRGNPITTLEFVTGDLTRTPDATSLNVSEVRAAIEDRINQLSSQGIASNLLTLVGGWEGAFDLTLEAMRGEVLGVPLPLIGDALADEADFLEDIKASVVNNIRDVADQGVVLVQNGIFDALGPGGLGLLQDATSDGAITADDVLYEISPDFQSIDFDLHLRQAVDAVELPVDFDLGLPGLKLEIDAPVELSFGADFRLGFGASIQEGFFFSTDPARTQLELFFDADVPQLSAAGELAFLDIIASTIPGAPTGFAGSFVVNMRDDLVGDGNGRISLNEMYAGDFSDVIDHTLSADADVALNLVVSLGDAGILPRLRTDLVVDWNFIAGQNQSAPDVRFENVELNLGDFFSGFAGEVLGEVQRILEPAQPVIDVLTARLPVISDLSGGTVTLVDLARLFGRADVADFAQAVIDVNNLVTGLPDIGPDTWVTLGGFGLDPGALGGYGGPGSSLGTTQISLMMTDVQTDPNPLGQVGSKAGSAGSQWTNNLQNARGSLRFPLLESPLAVFGLLLGRDVDLFLYDAPALGVDFSYSQFFPIPPIPILGAEIAGRIAAVADFAFGFDSSGISKFSRTGNFVDVFDGFYVSDRANPDGTGADVSEVYLRGSLTAGAKLELLLAEAGVRGGVFAGVDFNLNDPDRDGRVRGGELAENFRLGPIHIFDVRGRLDAGLSAYVSVNLLLFSIEEEFEIASAEPAGL